MRRETGDNLAAAPLLDEALGIFRDLGDRAGEPEALNEKGRCTEPAATSRRLRDATSGPWNRPAPSPAPRPRLTHWPAWAAAP